MSRKLYIGKLAKGTDSRVCGRIRVGSYSFVYVYVHPGRSKNMKEEWKGGRVVEDTMLRYSLV